MIGNLLKLDEFKQWLNYFNEYDEAKPIVKEIKCRRDTWFELYRNGSTIGRPFVESKEYDNGYIERMKKAGKLDIIYDAIE